MYISTMQKEMEGILWAFSKSGNGQILSQHRDCLFAQSIPSRAHQFCVTAPEAPSPRIYQYHHVDQKTTKQTIKRIFINTELTNKSDNLSLYST